MSRFSRRVLPLAFAFVLFIVLAVVFGIYDLPISISVVNQESSFGRTLETLGVLVAPVLATFSGIVSAVFFIRERSAKLRNFKIVCSIIAASAGVAYTFYIYAAFSFWQFIGYAVATLLLYAVIAFLAVKSPRALLYEWMRIAVVTIFYLITLLLLISILKLSWGRTRFRQLESFSQFTPWYQPRGYTGHVSFPSGHTANAAALIIFVQFVPLIKSRIGKMLCYIIPYIWVIIMGISRVLVGAHYASDVLFGAAISIVLFYCVRRIVFPRIAPLLPLLSDKDPKRQITTP